LADFGGFSVEYPRLNALRNRAEVVLLVPVFVPDLIGKVPATGRDIISRGGHRFKLVRDQESLPLMPTTTKKWDNEVESILESTWITTQRAAEITGLPVTWFDERTSPSSALWAEGPVWKWYEGRKLIKLGALTAEIDKAPSCASKRGQRRTRRECH
jgi:hypothetical protein